jgi:hypothetical protein
MRCDDCVKIPCLPVERRDYWDMPRQSHNGYEHWEYGIEDERRKIVKISRRAEVRISMKGVGIGTDGRYYARQLENVWNEGIDMRQYPNECDRGDDLGIMMILIIIIIFVLILGLIQTAPTTFHPPDPFRITAADHGRTASRHDVSPSSIA